MSTEFWLGVAIILLVVIAITLGLLTMAFVTKEYLSEPITVVCSKYYGKGFWFYEGDYIRDMNYSERIKYCPKPTNPQ